MKYSQLPRPEGAGLEGAGLEGGKDANLKI